MCLLNPTQCADNVVYSLQTRPIPNMCSYALSNDKMLVGFENIDEWKDLLLLSVVAQGLEDYLTTDFPDTQEHRINKAKLSFTILNSISSHIHHKLVLGGWHLASLDPKALFVRIKDICRGDNNLWKLGGEFRTISPDRFGTLWEFKERVIQLKEGVMALGSWITEEDCVRRVWTQMKPNYPRFLEGTKGFCQSDGGVTSLPVWQIVLDELDWLSDHLADHPQCDGYCACSHDPQDFMLI